MRNGRPPETPEEVVRRAERKRQRRDMLVQMTALGLEVSAAVLGGLVCGWYLDEHMGTGPWGVLVLTLGGMVTAFSRLLTLTRRFDALRRKDERDRA